MIPTLTVLMLWKSFMLCTNCQSPIAFMTEDVNATSLRRGDLLLVTNYVQDSFRADDLILLNIENEKYFVAGRIVTVSKQNDAGITITYQSVCSQTGECPSKESFIEKKDIIGKIRGRLPYIGLLIIWFKGYFLYGCIIYIIFTGIQREDNTDRRNTNRL
ncbi:unnamed protein product [Adineta ricciae]|uniref:Signal peptidase complex catalytic subunit SEC11 n=1 Tax=Adineta ricciae TaxID=249248 RepID=A0A816HGJ6_ADIRI|nr:unnamed protein product [Adineta ricciae]